MGRSKMETSPKQGKHLQCWVIMAFIWGQQGCWFFGHHRSCSHICLDYSHGTLMLCSLSCRQSLRVKVSPNVSSYNLCALWRFGLHVSAAWEKVVFHVFHVVLGAVCVLSMPPPLPYPRESRAHATSGKENWNPVIVILPHFFPLSIRILVLILVPKNLIS